MLLLLFYIFCLSFLFGVLLLMIWFICIKSSFCREKFSVFECGFDLLSFLRLPFSLHFYLVSIIFLVFDVEVVLLLPFIFLFKFTSGAVLWLMFFLFFMVLCGGLFYEWYLGLLNWLI